eukprot:CAMPEP_0115365178 /NCGR_PEP_ID=MMETSP0270-20121206/104148_1 /TAXON_ID=71861 /ORGANISM="Scrippsiella trochoidea, Strain CCMP3099" /LENGTH=51 /DNA_ID=CAMNT_0002787895 /DNA_START=423 /DNA_END=576 /DNA_ORIENTATION=+
MSLARCQAELRSKATSAWRASAAGPQALVEDEGHPSTEDKEDDDMKGLDCP